MPPLFHILPKEALMRRFLMCAAVLSVAWAGSVGHAQIPQMKVTNADDYSKAMKAIGAAFGGANKAIASGAMADAKAGVATAKANMMAVQGVWMANKKDHPAIISQHGA